VLPVVADADTLFGATTRGLLIHLDYQGSIRLHWSPLILDELSRALVDTGRKPDAESARRHEQLMRAALPQAEIPRRSAGAFVPRDQAPVRAGEGLLPRPAEEHGALADAVRAVEPVDCAKAVGRDAVSSP
jgi:hypothetical protein